jgi:hypothetical protein
MPIHSTGLACDNGWIHHQHPMKPHGVIMNSTPCPACNPQVAELNQCDGCARGMPLNDRGIHYNPKAAYDAIGCTAHLYKQA